MKIYRPTEYISDPKVGDLQLKVNSMWDFGSRNVCFEGAIAFNLRKCIEVKDGIIIGGTKKVKNTKWEESEVTQEIRTQLEKDGYVVNKKTVDNR